MGCNENPDKERKVMNDADMQMARCASVARGLETARKRGVCSHERRHGVFGGPQPIFQCEDCGKMETWESLEDDRREVLIEWT